MFYEEFDPNDGSMSSELFHYTSLSGLKGIVESRSLFATNFIALNDRMEFHAIRFPLLKALAPGFAKHLVKAKNRGSSRVRSRLKEVGGDLNKLSEVLTAKIIDNLVANHIFDFSLNSNAYVSSFCNHYPHSNYTFENGLLSMWNGYGKDGVAIVFDTLGLLRMLTEEAARFRYSEIGLIKVWYDDFDQESFEAEFEVLIQYLDRFLGNSIRNETFLSDDEMESMVSLFHQCISGVKHHAFHEESEVRIVCSPISSQASEHYEDSEYCKMLRKNVKREIKPRVNDNQRIVLFDTLNSPLPIKRIVVGPSNEIDEKLRKIQQIIEGLKIEVTVSDIPHEITSNG